MRVSAKQVLSEGGLQVSTRRGNRELDYLLKKVSQQSNHTREQADATGKELGELILEASKTRGRTHLDAGVIQQLMIHKKIPSLASAANASPSPTPESPTAAATQAAPPQAPGSASSSEDAVAALAADAESAVVEAEPEAAPEATEPEAEEPEATSAVDEPADEATANDETDEA